MKLFKIIAGAAVACAMLATSCTKEIPVPTGMTLDQSAVTIFVGQTACVSPEFTPSNAKATSLEWTSSDESVATVNGGYVKGIKAGSATITGKAQGSITATCSVTVKNVEATSFTLDKTELSFYTGQQGATLTATVIPGNVTFPEVSWSSSNEAVATVSAKGEVKPVGVGEAVITASLAGGQTATCKVTVTQGPLTVSLWKDDIAGSFELFGFAADEGKSAGEGGWLSWSNGNACWTANTTGAMRTATLKLDSGSEITVKQFSPAEFVVGNWALYSRRFNPNGTQSGTKGITAAHEAPVTIAAAEGENGNNITITGLYLDAVVEGQVVVDYEAKTVKFGMYCSHKIYDAGSGKYCVLLPECASNSGWWTGYNFYPKNDKAFSDTNYDWLWYKVSEDFNKMTYIYYGEENVQVSANGAYRYCGLSFVVASETEITGNSYDVIYQANYNGSNAAGEWFERK